MTWMKWFFHLEITILKIGFNMLVAAYKEQLNS